MIGEFENYAEISRDYDKTRGSVGKEILLGCFASMETPLSQQTILDAGCGTGNYIALLQDKLGSIVGIDANEGMLAQSKAKFADNPSIRFRQSILPDIPFEDESFDGIMCNQVIHHLDPENNYQQLKTFMQDAWRVLKTGGVFIIHTSSHIQLRESYWFYRLIPAAATINREKRPDIGDLFTYLQEQGFDRIRSMVPLNEVLQKAHYFDASGPLRETWRNGDSAWALATEKELQDAIKAVESVKEEHRFEHFIGRYEARRMQLGQSTFICANKS